MLPLAMAVTLQQVAEAPDPHRTFDGTLTYEGHGPVPGATSDHPFHADVHQDWAAWSGDGWTDRLWTDGRDAWAQDPWAPATDREVLKLWAARPARLARWLLDHPDEWTASNGAVLWAMDGHLATWRFTDVDTGTLSWRHAHPVFGDVEERVEWEDGRTALHFVEADTRWSAVLNPAPRAAAEAPPPPERVQVVDLGDGLYALEVPEADSRVGLCVRGTEGALLDAPLSNALGEALLRQAQQLAPQVTTWTVVVSHHHPHYTGGLRPWARSGARIVAPAAIASWLTEALGRPRSLVGDPGVAAQVLPVQDDLQLLGGALSVRPVDEASGHTEAFLLSQWHPSRTLYVADLARQPPEGPPRHRGTWPASVADWAPTTVLSGFPLSNPATFPFASLRD